ncbi:MAG: TetM/TetW/TetO/TetS family tetracycline resistance ribosomal protection protein [Lachnoclostridium sp.]|nr:TetM/TetW/TetO/TetS family tetracycline resistance ribosomal protection protein [Lachnospira sp.]MCM1247016.1 TetM/TetW/TetO/TetS family tetracycline resistance ribosomal protection protein [Lachnoclostridium sp.]
MSETKKLVLGILAHVDAGKTTLAEAALYLGGQLKRLGRVDHADAFLDNFALERERGITIFSKQARLQWNDTEIILLDTPGHVDFAAEMERTLQVLDYAVLVINGADGVQGHTRTLWKLLERYGIPAFLFVNKMDQPGRDGAALMESLKRQLDGNCVAFSETDYERIQGRYSEHGAAGSDKAGQTLTAQTMEEIATCGEDLMDSYLEQGNLTQEQIAQAIARRRLFPCYFGSALRVEGVEELLNGIVQYGIQPFYPEEFGAKVFKISRDVNGVRLTQLKVTGGELRVKMQIDNHGGLSSEEESFQEKIDQLRIYNGSGYEAVGSVKAGGVCAVTGLTKTFAGQGLGAEEDNELPVLEPVLTYRIALPEGEDAVRVLGQLKQLEEEEPLLHIVWQEKSREIHAQVMGDVQIEVLRKMIAERFHIEVDFCAGSIMYKETIAGNAVGIGHFEPLRHYAEVQLFLEPGERGSGLQFASLCSEDVLDRNWQRLILTHLEEKVHVGVLTGSPITDMRILLVAGRAHTKHTEGGDFRQATYRALRQGLMSVESVLLEPVFAFVLELPSEHLGRAMSDIQRMKGCIHSSESFDVPMTGCGRSILTGRAPVASMRDYQKEVNAYTHGEGHLSCVLDGYEPCHNGEEVIAGCGYDPEADLENPSGSVFCAHGAGFIVPWHQVPEYAHLEIPEKILKLVRKEDAPDHMTAQESGVWKIGRHIENSASEKYITQEEIDAIFRQTYGKREKDADASRRYHVRRREVYDGGKKTSGFQGLKEVKERCLLVDGYNIIFAWEELRNLAQINLDSARDRLMDIMSNYQGMQGGILILVFDAYKVKGNPGSAIRYHNIHVIYTKEAETADQYIEKAVHEMADKYQVTVATSDALEQMIIWGAGALRMSAGELYEAVEAALKKLREEYTDKDTKFTFRPFA